MPLRTLVAALLLAALAVTAAAGGLSARPTHAGDLTISAEPNPIFSGEGALVYRHAGGLGPGGKLVLHQLASPRGTFHIVQNTVADSAGLFEFSFPEGTVTTDRSYRDTENRLHDPGNLRVPELRPRRRARRHEGQADGSARHPVPRGTGEGLKTSVRLRRGRASRPTAQPAQRRRSRARMQNRSRPPQPGDARGAERRTEPRSGERSRTEAGARLRQPPGAGARFPARRARPQPRPEAAVSGTDGRPSFPGSHRQDG